MENSVDNQVAQALEGFENWGTIEDIYQFVCERIELPEDFRATAVKRSLIPIIRRKLKDRRDDDGLAFFESVEKDNADGTTSRVYKQLDLFNRDDNQVTIQYYVERATYHCRRANTLAKRCNTRLGTRRQMPFPGFGVLHESEEAKT